ncbi:MAG: serine hydroxymethyltransferase [Deltaproteobacteria bacterium]|nr:MAG: serine hydroxymethyltransferase [Deltaproteobacteria bacterium]
MDQPLAEVDPEIARLIRDETQRQAEGLELIASENFVSEAVLEAQGSILTNKYAEGLPGKRYYGGCEVVDKVEQLAIDRAKALFGAEHANVQPHAGSQANMATYFALLRPGDKILSLSLAQGGHLTHGSPVNFSGKLFEIHHYGLDPKTETIDYAAALKLAREIRPRCILGGASAYPRTLDFVKLREIAEDVGAVMIVDIAHIAGLVAVGLHPSPVPLADAVTTTTHKTLRGPRSGLILCKQQHAKAVDSNIFPGIQGGPLEHIIAAKAVAFGEALKPDFKDYQQRILDNAQALAAGLIEGGLRLVAGGTDTHLMLCDLRPKKLTGKIAESSLQKAHITTNKNMIPGDPEKPFVTSGLRLGTPALTTRGMGPNEMKIIARLIMRVLDKPDDEAEIGRVRSDVHELASHFPLYAKRLVTP